ncbi:hypothetical protein FYK55_12225 [Roseiconus nitratireducens]|uniref:Uncharacterized protein n=1 Tax=Roseiconus nitratireducens TaxID=2605748 RepID=A0A5M6D6A1_9BACT|nr:hypothetical protein [Roseiconus nitratireducens]KAA5543054.1 hypothetical protein FYK55_12225 [Roseiconus nitratireducens]
MLRILAVAVMLSFAGQDGFAVSPPSVQVTDVRLAFDNGEHNAFTDLTRFRDRYYLCFRSCPDGHMVHPTASIIVLVSDDLQQWHPVHQFAVKHRDTRDPHFLVFRDKLFVYTGTWYSGETTIPVADYDLNLHLGYAVWTDDGDDWTSPILLEGTFGHYIWRAARFGDQAFLCGRRKHAFDVRPRGEGPDVESAMLESDDGLVWKTRALFQETRGDETAFQFNSDGSLLAIARRGRGTAQVLRSKPPYTDWDRQDLSRYIGGPLLTRWAGRWVVGGRKATPDRGYKTALYWLEGDQLREFAELPSGGDNSYPGLLELEPGHAVVSWYSSHESNDDGTPRTAIYLADLWLDGDPSDQAAPEPTRSNGESP